MTTATPERAKVTINRSALTDFMKAAGLDGAELARRAGISQPYLSQIRTGKRQPTNRVLKQIADALGISVLSLFSQASQCGDTHVA